MDQAWEGNVNRPSPWWSVAGLMSGVRASLRLPFTQWAGTQESGVRHSRTYALVAPWTGADATQAEGITAVAHDDRRTVVQNVRTVEAVPAGLSVLDAFPLPLVTIPFLVLARLIGSMLAHPGAFSGEVCHVRFLRSQYMGLLQ